MISKEALENIRITLKKDFNFPLNLTEEYKTIKADLDQLELLEKKCQNGKYILTIQGNMNMAKSAIEIVIEKYGAENVIIKHLPTLGIVDNDYFKTKLEKIGE